MVIVDFKLTDVGRIELDIPTPLEFAELLRYCVDKVGYTSVDCIGVKNGKVLGSGDIIADGDCIDVFPALSGG